MINLIKMQRYFLHSSVSIIELYSFMMWPIPFFFLLGKTSRLMFNFLLQWDIRAKSASTQHVCAGVSGGIRDNRDGHTGAL